MTVAEPTGPAATDPSVCYEVTYQRVEDRLERLLATCADPGTETARTVVTSGLTDDGNVFAYYGGGHVLPAEPIVPGDVDLVTVRLAKDALTLQATAFVRRDQPRVSEAIGSCIGSADAEPCSP